MRSRSSTVHFRWFRWSTAVVFVSTLALTLRRVAVHFGPSDGETWWSLLRDDIDAFVLGNVSREMVVRGALLVMAVALIWISGSLVSVVMSYRHSLRVPRSLGRWAAFFVCGSAMVTSSIVAAAPVRAASMAVITEERQPVVLRTTTEGNSELTLVTTSVVSGLVGAGLAIRWRARDHESRRRAGVDDQVEVESPGEAISEEALGEMCRAERNLDEIVDVVTRIRRLAPDGEIRHVVDELNGWYVVEFTRPVKAIPHTELVTNRAVRLRPDSSRPPREIEDAALPVLMHVGRIMSGEVWVSLDAYGDFGVDCASDEGERVWRHLCDSLVLAPTSTDRGLVSDVDLESTGPRRTYRVSHGSLVADGARRLGESIAVIHADEPGSTAPTLRRVTTGDVGSGLVRTGGEWRLLPTDVSIRPVGTGDDDIRRIRDLLGDPLPVIEVTEPSPHDDIEDGANDSRWTFMAQVLGPPRVVDRRFEIVEFERGKAEELVIWLAFHPQQRKRSLARTALWLSPVQDATFSNITAAARRSLNAVASPPPGHAWVGITMSDDLPLAEGFATDVDMLRNAVELARHRPEENGLGRLREVLQLVRGVPFAGSTYTWSDGIGMSGDAATLVVRAAATMAEMCQEIGDMSGVYWASAKGLLALPGHEELVAIRLRAHAEHGDRVAMKAEWESYRRAVASEWGDAEPSPKMMELWRRLSGV